MIDGSPKVFHLAVDADVDLVEISLPVSVGPHAVASLPANLRGEHRVEAVSTSPHRLVAEVNAALMQQVLHVPERQWVFDVEHHHPADHLGGGIEPAERIVGLLFCGPSEPPNGGSLTRGAFRLTKPPPHLAVDLHVDIVEMPVPVSERLLVVSPLTPHLNGKN